MPDDRYTVSGDFVPTGFVRGVDVAEAKLSQLEDQVQRLAAQFPKLDPQDFMHGFIEGAQVGIRELRTLRDEANRTQQALSALPAGGRLASRFGPPPVLPGGPGGSDPGSVQRMTQAFNEAGEAQRRASEGAAAWSRGLAALNVTAVTATGTIRGTGHSTAQMTQHFVTVAAASLGADTALARVASTLLSMSIGFTKIAIGAGIIFGIAKAIEVLTARQREATKERERLNKALTQRMEAALPSTTGLQREVAAAAEKEALLQERINNALSLQGRFRLDALRIATLQTQAAQQHRLVEEGTALLEKLRANEQIQTLRDITAAGEHILQFNRQIQEQAADFRAKATAAGPQTFAAQPGFVSEQEHQALQERRQLIEQATAAEVRGLQTRRDLAARVVAENEDERKARSKEIALIELAITARRVEGQAQLQNIAFEEALLGKVRQRAREELDHARRVEAAGGGNLLGAGPLTVDPRALKSAADFERERAAALPPILRGHREDAELLATAGDRVREQLDMTRAMRTHWQDIQDQIVAGASALLSFGNNITGILGNVVNMAQEFGNLQQATKDLGNATTQSEKLAATLAKVSAIGGIIGSAFSAISAVGSMLGPSPKADEHARIVKENSERLAQLRLSLDRQLEGAAAALRAKDILAITRTGAGPAGRIDDATVALNRALASTGLTLQEFDRLVRDTTGIEILDSEGELIGKAFRQATAALEITIDSITHFGTSLSAVREQVSARNRIFGAAQGPVADAQAQREVLLRGLNLAPAIEAKIAGLDLNTAVGRQAFQAFLQSLYAMAAAGQLTAEQLGVFANVDEAISAAADAADALTQANLDAADAAKANAEAEKTLADINEEIGRHNRELARQFGDLEARLRGEPQDAMGQFQRELELLTHVVPGLKDAFEGLNLDDPGIKEALRQKLIDLFEHIPEGLDPSLLQEFFDFLGLGADVLDSFNQATEAATKSLTNMPTGINLAALEFQAQAASPIPWPRSAGGQPLQPITQRMPGDGAMLPVDARIMGDVTITIVQQPGESSEDLARRIERVLGDRQVARTGIREGWGGL